MIHVHLRFKNHLCIRRRGFHSNTHKNKILEQQRRQEKPQREFAFLYITKRKRKRKEGKENTNKNKIIGKVT